MSPSVNRRIGEEFSGLTAPHLFAILIPYSYICDDEEKRYAGMYRLMLVDDEPLVLLGMEEIIDWEAEGFTIVARCGSGREALEQADQFCPDAVVTDIRMPDMSGIELLEEIRKRQPQTEFFVVSAYSDFEVAREAIRLAALYYVLKPLSESEFLDAARCMRKKLDQRQEHRKKRLKIDRKNPVFPACRSRGRDCYLLLAFRLEHLPPKDDDAALWCEIETEHCFGVLTDKLPLHLPDQIGVSIGVPDCQDASLMLRSAYASLEGGFRFCGAQERSKSEVSAADIQLYLFEHLIEEVSLEQLAQNFFITKTYCCDVFKRQSGETVLGFLKKIRLNCAKRLLAETTMPLPEVAYRCGYRDYSHFGKHFKTDVGSSPELYRKQARAAGFQAER